MEIKRIFWLIPSTAYFDALETHWSNLSTDLIQSNTFHSSPPPVYYSTFGHRLRHSLYLQLEANPPFRHDHCTRSRRNRSKLAKSVQNMRETCDKCRPGETRKLYEAAADEDEPGRGSQNNIISLKIWFNWRMTERDAFLFHSHGADHRKIIAPVTRWIYGDQEKTNLIIYWVNFRIFQWLKRKFLFFLINSRINWSSTRWWLIRFRISPNNSVPPLPLLERLQRLLRGWLFGFPRQMSD